MDRIVITVMGRHGIGKTYLLRHLTKTRLDESIAPTIGVDYYSLTKKVSRSLNFRIAFWEVCGDSRFHWISKPYLDRSHAIYYCFDALATEEDILADLTTFFSEEARRALPIVFIGLNSRHELLSTLDVDAINQKLETVVESMPDGRYSVIYCDNLPGCHELLLGNTLRLLGKLKTDADIPYVLNPTSKRFSLYSFWGRKSKGSCDADDHAIEMKYL